MAQNGSDNKSGHLRILINKGICLEKSKTKVLKYQGTASLEAILETMRMFTFDQSLRFLICTLAVLYYLSVSITIIGF